jgi:3-methylcrotonyl-CoA carboxylase alpha subunit/geranyl-CoA carboxylase alpha subunit
MLTGLDLVEWQLRIARGEALPLSQADVQLQGHAIEVRLCAEDEHFTPQTGTVLAFTEPTGLRFDHALHAGAVVTPHYDSMLGKLIAHAPTRLEVIERLSAGLQHTTLLGLPTNRAFLTACLQHPVFRAGEALIPFLTEQAHTMRERLHATTDAQTVAALAVLYAQHPPAQHMASPFARPVRIGFAGQPHAWQAAVHELGQGQVRVHQGDDMHTVQIQHAPNTHPSGTHHHALLITLNGVHWTVQTANTGGTPARWHVQMQGPQSAELWLSDQSHSAAASGPNAQAAALLRAPFNGKLIALHVREGDSVKQGDALLVIESMKLEHTLTAARDAVVHSVPVSAGQQVGPGQVLVQWQEAK